MAELRWKTLCAHYNRTYDGFKRLNSESSSHYNGNIQFRYDQLGNKIGTVLNINGKIVVDVKRSFNQNNDNFQGSAYFLTRRANYEKFFDNARRFSGYEYPNGVRTGLVLDKNSRVVEQNSYHSNFFHRVTYNYSATGNTVWTLEQLDNGRRLNRYEYDGLDRLIKEDSMRAQSYTLDPVGNALDNNSHYNSLNQLLENNDYIFQYDLNGNRTEKKWKTSAKKYVYEWSQENQLNLIRIFNSQGNLSKTISYSYDGVGRRIKKEVQDHLTPNSSYIRKFVYDGDNILAVLDQNDRFIVGYLQGTSVDEPIAMAYDSNGDNDPEIYSFIRDSLGSVLLVLNEKGETVQEVSYSAYGETKVVTRGPKLENSFYYTSRELEVETGEYYYRARYYDPYSQRFLSEDPISFLGKDINLFRYTRNNPLLFKDPSGKDARIIGVILVGVAIWTVFDIAQGPQGTMYQAVNTTTGAVVTGWNATTAFAGQCSQQVTSSVNDVLNWIRDLIKSQSSDSSSESDGGSRSSSQGNDK